MTQVALNKAEIRAVKLFARSSKVTKARLLKVAYPDGEPAEKHADFFMHTLRKKLPEAAVIVTVRGEGYEVPKDSVKHLKKCLASA